MAAIGVGAGALGAHALEARLEPDALADYQTAVRYQLLHALALVAFGTWIEARESRRGLRAPAVLFTLGTVLFSGSIYLLVFDLGSSWVWPATPLGGTLLLVAWIFWAYQAWRGR